MIRPIRAYGDPCLRQACRLVDDRDGLDLLIQDLFDTMDAAKGVGLAAPQIGVDLRVFVIGTANLRAAFVNPAIWGEEQFIRARFGGARCVDSPEGCLSIPGMRGLVPRFREIEILSQDGTLGETRKIELHGLEAIAAQHELDHLDGVLYIDHMSQDDRSRVEARLKAIELGEFGDAPYELAKR
jgi:peptide deformylase